MDKAAIYCIELTIIMKQPAVYIMSKVFYEILDTMYAAISREIVEKNKLKALKN